MRSHIYVRTGRTGVLVITVGEPEAFVKRRERLFTVPAPGRRRPLPLQLPEHTGDLVSGDVGQRPVGVELGEQSAKDGGAGAAVVRVGTSGEDRKTSTAAGPWWRPGSRSARTCAVIAPASRRLLAHRWMVAVAPESRPTVRGLWPLPSMTRTARRSGRYRPGATQGLADAQPSPAENRDQGAVTEASA